jgi:zinc transporter
MQTIQLRSSLNPDSDEAAIAPGETWIDTRVADDEGRRWLASQSGLGEEIVGRLLEPALITCWRRFGQGLHLNVHSPVPAGNATTIAFVGFGIWLEPGRIITVSRGEVPLLQKAAEACSVGAGPSSSWGLVAFVLSEGLSRLERNLHDLSATIDQLEDEVVTGVGDPPIHRVAELQNQLIYSRRFRATLASMVNFISSQPKSVIDGAVRDELEGIANVFAQYHQVLDLLLDRAASLQGQIRDELADSMNSATYRFTWVATVFLPLSFLTGLLGINVAGIPGDHDPKAFWLVCGALCVITAAWGIIVGRLTTRFSRRPDAEISHEQSSRSGASNDSRQPEPGDRTKA